MCRAANGSIFLAYNNHDRLSSGAGVTWEMGDCAPYGDDVEVLTFWGTNYGSPEPVPEPAAPGLLVGALMGILRRR